MSLPESNKSADSVAEYCEDAEQDIVEYCEAAIALINSEFIVISFDDVLVEDDLTRKSGKQFRSGMSELINCLHGMGKNLYIRSDAQSGLVRDVLSEELSSGVGASIDLLLSEEELGSVSTYTKLSNLLTKHGLSLVDLAYIGNSNDEIIEARESGMKVISTSEADKDSSDAIFVEDFSRLTRVIRDNTDGASFVRMRSKYPDTAFVNTPEFSADMNAAVMQGMVVGGLKRLWNTKLRTSTEAYSSPIWSDRFMSLRKIQNFCDNFGAISGEINIEQFGPNPIISSYYTDDRVYPHGGVIGLRGPRYFSCVDTRYTPSERISMIISELHASVGVLQDVEREALDVDDLLPYLGILDNAKQQALSLFHAFTFDERRYGISQDQHYILARAKLLDVATNLTRSFIETCLGRSYTTPAHISDIYEVENIMRRSSEQIGQMGLKIQELDHPLKVMLAAYNLSGPGNIDTVVGFPSGGTQLAVVTAMSNEILYNKSPRSVDIVCIPLSQHSGARKVGARPISDEDLVASVGQFSCSFEGKNIVVVDDNASTGSTINRAVRALACFGPLSITTGVAEIDPQRILIRSEAAAREHTNLVSVNLQHSAFDTAIGVNPISGRDIQLRKLYARRVLGISPSRFAVQS